MAILFIDVLWFTRNQVVHNSYKINIKNILKQISFTVKNHMNAWDNISPSVDLWNPPPDGSLKANFDVAVRSKFSVTLAVVNDKIKK